MTGKCSESDKNPTLDHQTLQRRPRGRPTGSKNKPKPPIIITRDAANSLKAQAMEITSGCDVSECLLAFARKKQRGVCVLSATGCVTNVNLKQPSSTSIVTLHGRFEILSLTGSVLPPPAPPGVNGLTIFMGAGQGQVVGGSVVGGLIASGPVVIMAATFMNATFDRLPLMDRAEEEDCQRFENKRRHLDGDVCDLQVYGVTTQNLLTNGGLASENNYGWGPMSKS